MQLASTLNAYLLPCSDFLHQNQSLLKYKTIKLIIQPIIENAIYHGIGTGKNEGIIEVVCVDDTNSIMFIVKDNGGGMAEEKLKEINDILKSSSLKKMHGIYNVQSRIFIYFGRDYGLEIQSRLGEGTTAIIRIPKIRRDIELLVSKL